MDIIDDEGRLFGAVNVIDALVVLLVLGVFVAGIALLNPFASSPDATRYATVDLGTHPDYVASQIDSGDQLAPTTRGNLTVTDVYYSPTAEEDVRVIARVRLQGSLSQESDTFQFAGSTLQQGGELTLNTPDYTATGTVTRLEQSGATLQTDEATVQLNTIVAPDVAEQLSVGDTVTAADSQVATVDAVTVGPTTKSTTRYVTLSVTVQAYTGGNQPQFANRSLTLGSTLPLDTSAYTISGQITQFEQSEINTSTTHIVVESTVSPAVADELDVGDTYTIAGTDIGTVESLQLYPGDGDQQYAVMGLSLRTRLTNGEAMFGETEVTIGASIPFRTDTYALTATVSRIGSAPVDTTTTDVVFEATVPTTTAHAITTGDTYTIHDSTVAKIDSLQVYPTGNPAEKRVVVGASLQTIVQGGTPEFAGTPVKLGTTIPIETASYEFTGSVVRVGSQTPPGDVTEITIRLKIANIHPDIADGIRVGMTETQDGTTSARITALRSENATVVLTSEGGDIFRREHPVNQDVFLTVDLRARKTDTGLTFHARSLQEGTEVVLDLGSITIRGTVIKIE